MRTSQHLRSASTFREFGLMWLVQPGEGGRGEGILGLIPYRRWSEIPRGIEMDLSKALKELHEQQDKLNLSILALERVEAAKPRGRGRPPKRMADGKAADAPKRRGRPHGSGETSAAATGE